MLRRPGVLAHAPSDFLRLATTSGHSMPDILGTFSSKRNDHSQRRVLLDVDIFVQHAFVKVSIPALRSEIDRVMSRPIVGGGDVLTPSYARTLA